MMGSIWMFHRILPDTPVAFGLPNSYRLRGTAITPEEWERFLAKLDAPASLRGTVRGTIPDSAPVLTFDDGYREWIDVVAPSLRQRGWTATFFACRAFRAEADRAQPIDEFYWLLDNAAAPQLDIRLPGGRQYAAQIDTLEGKREAIFGDLKLLLYSASPDAAQELLNLVAESVGLERPRGLPGLLYPTEAEWRQLAAEFDVGAHGLSHRRGTDLSDSDLRAELAGSLLWVRSIGGLTLWSHPDGAQDARVARLVADAGFEAAVGVGLEGGQWNWPRRFGTPEAIGAESRPPRARQC